MKRSYDYQRLIGCRVPAPPVCFRVGGWLWFARQSSGKGTNGDETRRSRKAASGGCAAVAGGRLSVVCGFAASATSQFEPPLHRDDRKAAVGGARSVGPGFSQGFGPDPMFEPAKRAAEQSFLSPATRARSMCRRGIPRLKAGAYRSVAASRRLGTSELPLALGITPSKHGIGKAAVGGARSVGPGFSQGFGPDPMFEPAKRATEQSFLSPATRARSMCRRGIPRLKAGAYRSVAASRRLPMLAPNHRQPTTDNRQLASQGASCLR
jgi:hypothetical protein